MQKYVRFILILLTTVKMLVACHMNAAPPLQPGEVNVPFETMAQDQWGVDHDPSHREPKLFLLATKEELPQVKDLVDQKVMRQLEQVDFQQYMIVALFRGTKPSSNYQTTITRLTQKDNELIVYAQFWEPNTAYASATAYTSPYHIIKLASNNFNTTKAKLVLQSIVLTPTR